MPAGVIHFVTETGQSENGVPGKKRLSRINSHVARFSHNRRKNNKNSNSAGTGATVSSQLLNSGSACTLYPWSLTHQTAIPFAGRLCPGEPTNRRVWLVL